MVLPDIKDVSEVVSASVNSFKQHYSTNTLSFIISRYSKTCLNRNLTGPENFSAKASFRLIEVHCLKRNLKGPEHFPAKARLN
jgi:hypothetical protein